MSTMFNGSQSPVARALHLCSEEAPDPTEVLARGLAGRPGGGVLWAPYLHFDQFSLERFLITQFLLKKSLYY